MQNAWKRVSKRGGPVEGRVPYLRCHVVWRAAERVGRSVQEDLELAHAKVRDSYMAVKVEQHVVQFEIAVNDALLVQKIQSGPDLGGVKPRAHFGKSTGLLDVKHQIASVQVLHHEEEVRLGLKGAEQVAEVRVPRRQSENLPLDQRAFDIVVLENHVLLQTFHRVNAFRAAQFRQQDFTEAAFTQDLRDGRRGGGERGGGQVYIYTTDTMVRAGQSQVSRQFRSDCSFRPVSDGYLFTVYRAAAAVLVPRHTTTSLSEIARCRLVELARSSARVQRSVRWTIS